MTSERQIEANRRNSRKSCGPRSEAGRQRAARNAFKYGLSITNNDAAEINELAIKIAGPLQDLDVFECAQIIAAAEIELRRVARVRASLFEGAEASALTERSAKRAFGQRRSTATRDTLCDFQNIQRYEQRAIARRDKALRRLLLLKSARKS